MLLFLYVISSIRVLIKYVPRPDPSNSSKWFIPSLVLFALKALSLTNCECVNLFSAHKCMGPFLDPKNKFCVQSEHRFLLTLLSLLLLPFLSLRVVDDFTDNKRQSI